MSTLIDATASPVDEGELFGRAVAEFAARVDRVADRWTAPTPCPGWDVRGLVGHVVGEQHWAVALLGGATIAEVGDRLSGDLLGADPAVAAQDAARAALAAVRADGVLARVVHLSFGDIVAGEYVMQLAADHLVHAWDMACALGEDDALDPGVVTAIRDWFVNNEVAYRTAGLIGPRALLPSNPTPVDELLAMFGRASALAPVARFNAAFATKDADAVLAAMTPDCVFEDTQPPDGRRHLGTTAVRVAFEELFAGAPRGRFETEELLAAGERVVARWRYDWGAGHVRGIDLFTVRHGKVAEKLAYVKG
jgi:uncharacterized protein (TIGR03086 family)